MDKGRSAWILHLEAPVTVNGKQGSETEVIEKNVTEVHLRGDDSLLESAAASKNSVTCYGTLQHATTTHHLRPVMMNVGAYKDAAPPVREIRRSPDDKSVIAWADTDLGPPLGEIRSIFLRSGDDESSFSLVTTPGHTDAAWSPSSSRCVIADMPDMGGPRTWLVTRENEDASAWKPRKIDPFRELEKTHYEHYEADPASVDQPMFRPRFLKIEWLSGTLLRFRGYCNTGTYLLTVDTDKPEEAAKVEKLSDRLLEE